MFIHLVGSKPITPEYPNDVPWLKSRRHMISFDRSGLDVCHYRSLEKILRNRNKGNGGFGVFQNLGKDLTIWQGTKTFNPYLPDEVQKSVRFD